MKFFIALIIIQIATTVYADAGILAVPDNETKVDSLRQIVFDSEVSYTKKLETMSSHSSLSLYSEYSDKLLPMYEKLLGESYGHADKEGTFFCFSSIANLYFSLLERDSIEKYLNNAEELITQINDVSYLALFYSVKAQYLQHFIPDRMKEAVNYYQISLSNYDKLGVKGKKDEIAVMLRNLSVDALYRNDSVYINKTIRKLKELRDYQDSPVVEFLYLDVISVLYKVYYNYASDERYLDSTNYYLQKCLDIYEQGLLPKSFDIICNDIYTVYAETVSMKTNPDIAVIDSLLSMAIEKKIDSMGMARIYQTKARTFFNRKMIDSAEVMALKSQSYLQFGYKDNDYSLEKRNYDFLRAIYEMKGDYKKVIEYNELWAKKSDEIRANEVKELVLQFEAEMKESELKKLVAEELYQKNRSRLFFLICALLCLTTLFLIFLFSFKRRNMNSQLALIAAEREETKLMVKLKEEQTVKMQLEKYMTLSDFRLKELELIGKTKDLEQLYKDKEELDKQVELFRQKVEAIEATIEKEEQEEGDIQYVITDDLKRLFAKQTSLTNYLENLEKLNKSYVDTIIAISHENLSVSYLKYCVCFAIGMGIGEVADCFNIEQASVHMIRYRLKKKFGLSNDDDLSQFLQEQVQN